MIRWVLGVAVVVTAGVLLLVVVVELATSDRTDVTDLGVGDCFDLDLGEGDGDFAELLPVVRVSCDDEHGAQVVAVGDLNPTGDRPYPDDDDLLAEVDALCAVVAPDPRFGIVPILPTNATWNARDGRSVCVALVIGGGTVTGDHASLAG